MVGTVHFDINSFPGRRRTYFFPSDSKRLNFDSSEKTALVQSTADHVRCSRANATRALRKQAVSSWLFFHLIQLLPNVVELMSILDRLSFRFNRRLPSLSRRIIQSILSVVVRFLGVRGAFSSIPNLLICLIAF
uniref:Uncharacterized protein n=1 Tax=Heterorhabditis bacteriophora TaxID=37862 RepID=A0A1I7WAA1_HETBA